MLDAVIVVTLDGKIIGWNGIAEHVFGWRSDEAEGRPLSELIIPLQHRAAHDEGMRRMLEGAEPRVLNKLIEITALHRDGREFPVELSITMSKTSAGSLFVGFLRDISLRMAAEDAMRRQALESALMFDLASIAADANSFEDVVAEGLAAICRLSAWPVGHAFTVVGKNPGELVSTGIWHESEPGLADRMRKATAEIDWAEGIGLPGTILATGEPVWLSDVGDDANFPRRHAGFRGCFGFPLTFEGNIIAILEFFSASPTEPDRDMLLMVRSLGEQIGRVFERRRRQDREALLMHELNHRVKNLLMVVQAIARQTFKTAATPDEGLGALMSRLRALAKAHDLLLASDMRIIGLRDAVEGAIEGSGNALERFTMQGRNIMVPGKYATPIVLAVHELCTNSVKYGSLSSQNGSVAISWGKTGDCGKFAFDWIETGGPEVTRPSHRGFGSLLLTRMLEAELGGKVEIDFAPTGLHCRLIAPVLAAQAS